MTTTRTPEHTEFLIDILNAAAEGGVNYWANLRGYRWDLTKHSVEDVGMEVQDIDNELGDWYKVSLETIEVGIERFLNLSSIDPDIRSDLEESVRNLDATNIDADAADAIVQVALFGEIVYC